MFKKKNKKQSITYKVTLSNFHDNERFIYNCESLNCINNSLLTVSKNELFKFNTKDTDGITIETFVNEKKWTMDENGKEIFI